MPQRLLGRNVRVATSAVHGRGLFARRRIRGDAFIGTFDGEPTRRNGMHVLWVLEDDGVQRGILGKNVLRFLNHDSNPNAEFRGADLHAVRNIQPGAEIVIDYGENWSED